MKTIFTITALFALSFASRLHAQCALSGLTINVNKLTPAGANCIVDFDLSFYIADNNGNKTIHIFLWKESDYAAGIGDLGSSNWISKPKLPAYIEMDGGGTKNADSHGPIAVIGVTNTPGVTTEKFLDTYSADPANVNYQNGKFIKGTSVTGDEITALADANSGKTFFVIKGLQIIQPTACTGVLALKGNMLGSQSGGASQHCGNNQFNFVLGNVSLNTNTVMFCSDNQRNFQLSLDVTSATTISYNVYVDTAGNGLARDENGNITDPVAYSSANDIPVSPNPAATDYNSGTLTLKNPYNTDPQYNNKAFYLVVSYIDFFGSHVTASPLNLPNICTITALPVKFTFFTATRNQQKKEQVLLKWETATEQNNRGFYVQRMNDGLWKNVAFVFSQADNGNSTSVLAYEYKDSYISNESTQYRILQVDMDGKASYSDVKTVAGIRQANSVTIYPNPALNGKVTLLFKNSNSLKDIIVADNNGQVVKQVKQIKSNELIIEGLKGGFYTIKIIDYSTATSTVEKLIVH